MISISEVLDFSQYDSREIVGIGLEQACKRNSNFVVFYADVGRRFCLDGFRAMGGRCIDTGIAEQSMIGAAAGFAHEGIAPVVISYAPFVTGRVFDQIKFAVGEMGLPLKIIGAVSGLCSGGLGPLSTCFEDIALMRTIPGLVVVSPADCLEAVKCIEAAMATDGPVYIRMTGGKEMTPIYQEDYSFHFGRAVPLRKGKRVAVISTGAVISRVLKAVSRLEDEGTAVTVLNMHTVKPLDTNMLGEYHHFEAFVTVEEHSIFGGLGSAVAEYLAGLSDGPVLYKLGINDRYFAADHYHNLLDAAGLSVDRIYHRLSELLQRNKWEE